MRRRALPPMVPTTAMTTAGLRARGYSDHALGQAVRDGRLLRPRRGRYLLPDTHPAVVQAIAGGGVVDCVSLLVLLGVFVFDHRGLHIAVPGDSSGLGRARGVTRHWRDDLRRSDTTTAPLVDAVRQSVRCQAPRHALASLDSALRTGVIDRADLADVFAGLPRRYTALEPMVDPRSESGPETLVRLMLRAIGCPFDVQVAIDGVGRVDFLVDGWLIVECDSDAHHSSWAQRLRDLRRDQEATAIGFTCIRIAAEDILYRPDIVSDLLRRVIAGDRRQGRRR